MRFAFLLTVIFWSQYAFSQGQEPLTPPEDLLRKKIFKETPHLAECKTLTKAVGQPWSPHSPELDLVLKDLQKSFAEVDADRLSEHFHPRLRITSGRLNSLLKNQRSILGSPLEVSIFKLFAINSVDGHPQALPCYGESIAVWPLTSYSLQFAVWLQLSGPTELGRVFLTLVPEKDKKWFIGSFRFQQWTHGGRSHEDWISEGDSIMKMVANGKMSPEARLAAWIKYDLAEKLIDGRHLFRHDLVAKIEKGKPMKLEEWQKNVKSLLPKKELLHSASILTVDGDGILLRFQIPAEISIENLRNDCAQTQKEMLKTTKWFGLVGGLRCTYVVEGEDPSKDGKLGGVYLGNNI